MSETARLYAVTAELEPPAYAEPAPATLLTFDEMDYVTETATGLTFREDTPVLLWGGLTERLIRASKRLEWCIADSINFGEWRYGDDVYTQWVEETGLNKRTLQNIARIGRLVEPARRRAEISFSHHEAVAKLPAKDQDELLDAAESAGMTRYDLRDAARKRHEELLGRAVDAEGAEIETAELCWSPSIDELVPEVRQAVLKNAPTGRHRSTWITAVMWAFIYADQRDLFTEWQGPES